MSPKDCILYALGRGLRARPPRRRRSLPSSMRRTSKCCRPWLSCSAIPASGSKDLDTGIDWVKIVAGEYALELHRPLGPQGEVLGRTRVIEIVDKGAGKGAILYSERTHRGRGQRRAASRPCCRPPSAAATAASAARRANSARCIRFPEARRDARLRPADAAGDGADLSAQRRPQSAARRPGGGQGRRLCRARSCTASPRSASPATPSCARYCGYDPARLTALAGRFSAPVFPGETIRTEMWRDGGDRELPRAASSSATSSRSTTVAPKSRYSSRAWTMPIPAARLPISISRRCANPCARFARAFPATTGARSIASAAIRPNSSPR